MFGPYKSHWCCGHSGNHYKKKRFQIFLKFIIEAFLGDLLKFQEFTAALCELLLDMLPAPRNLLKQNQWQFILPAYFKFLGLKNFLSFSLMKDVEQSLE